MLRKKKFARVSPLPVIAEGGGGGGEERVNGRPQRPPSFPAQLKSNETFFAAAIPDKVKKR